MTFAVPFNKFGFVSLPKAVTTPGPASAPATAKPPAAPKVPAAPAGEPSIDSDTTKHPGEFGYQFVNFTGPAFGAAGPKDSEVYQQSLNDCPVCAAAASTALMRPEALAKMFGGEMVNGKMNPKKMGGTDGNYKVTFAKGNRTIPVTGLLPVYFRPATPTDKSLLYGGSDPAHSQDPSTMRMWFAALQKAYAVLMGPASKPSYDSLNDGMDPTSLWKNWFGWKTFETEPLTGSKKTNQSQYLMYQSPDVVFNRIAYSVKNKCPATLTTFGHQADYDKSEDNTVVGDHTYSVIDCTTDKNGNRWVKIRNPWGSVAPKGTGPDGTENDDKTGFFWLPLQPLKPKEYPKAPKFDVMHAYEGFQCGFPPGTEPSTAADKKLFKLQ